MSVSINQVTLLGNVGGEPVVKNLENGSLLSFSLATSKSWKDKQGEWQERTEWHNIKAFGFLAENGEKWIKKGTKLCCIGSIRYNKVDKDGDVKYYTEIIAKDLVRAEKSEKKYEGGNAETPEVEEDNDLPF